MSRVLWFLIGTATALVSTWFLLYSQDTFGTRANCSQKFSKDIYGYCKSGDRIFWIDEDFANVFQIGALQYVGTFPSDPGTFVDLGSGFGKDSVQVYDHGYPVGSSLSIDSQSFEVVEAINKGDRAVEHCEQYSKDRLHVFFSSCNPDSLGQIPMIVLKDADPSTFHVIGVGANGLVYGSDVSRVYYSGREVEGSDPASFLIISKSVGGCEYDALDKFHRFWAGEIIDASRAKYGECSNQ